MHATAVGAGADLPATHDDVLGEVRFRQRHAKRDVDVVRVVGDGIRLLDLDDEVRCAVRPSVVGLLSKHLGRWGIGPVARRGAGLDPAQNRLDLAVGQSALVLEDTEGRGCEPRRHLPRLDLACDRPRPGAGLLIVHERHRRQEPAEIQAGLSVAGLTVLLQDRQHVLVVGFAAVALVLGHGRSRDKGDEEKGDNRRGSQRHTHACSSKKVGQTVGTKPDCLS